MNQPRESGGRLRAFIRDITPEAKVAALKDYRKFIHDRGGPPTLSERRAALVLPPREFMPLTKFRRLIADEFDALNDMDISTDTEALEQSSMQVEI